MMKRAFGVLVAAFLLVGALTGVALAAPPSGTFTVTCPDFDRHQGQEKAGEFSQTLPNKAKEKGSETSLEKSAGGTECVTS